MYAELIDFGVKDLLNEQGNRTHHLPTGERTICSECFQRETK